MSKYSKSFVVQIGDIIEHKWGPHQVFVVSADYVIPNSKNYFVALVHTTHGNALTGPRLISRDYRVGARGNLTLGAIMDDTVRAGVTGVKRNGVPVKPDSVDPNEIELEPGDAVTRASTGIEYTYVSGVEGAALVDVDTGEFWDSKLRDSNRLSVLGGLSWGKTSRIVDRKGKIKYLAE